MRPRTTHRVARPWSIKSHSPGTHYLLFRARSHLGRSARATAVGIALALAACAVWLFSGALFSGNVLAGDGLVLFAEPMSDVRPASVTAPANPLNFDSAHVFHPDLIAARRAVRSGDLPAWTDGIAAGRPLLAAQQSAPLYPTNWPAYVLPFWDSLEVTALLKVLLAAAGMALFCLALGLGAPAALLGALGFAFSTYFVGWLAHPHTNVYLLLPWIMLGVHRTIRGPSVAAAAGLAAALALSLLGGHMPSVLLIALLVVPYALFELAASRPARANGPAASLLAGAVVLGALGGAAMLLPLVEGLAHAVDSTARGGQVLPRTVANAFFFPELWGRPDKFELGGAPSNFQERTGYFGAAPLLLAVAGLAVRVSREQIFFAAAGLAAAAIVFVAPVASALDALPGYANANLWRAIVLMAFCGAVLGAFGLQRLIEADRRQRARIATIAGMLALGVAAQWIVRHGETLGALRGALAHLPSMDATRQDPMTLQLGAVIRWLAIGAAVVVMLALATWRARLLPIAVAAVLAIAAVDVVSIGRGYHPAVPKESVDVPAPPSVAFMRDAERHDGSRSAGEGFSFPANLSNRFGTHDPREHELPTVERYHRVWHALRGAGEGNTLQRKLFWSSPVTDRLVDAFAVRWLYSPTLASAPRPGYRGVPGHPKVFENVDAFPRAWVAYSWRGADGFEDALAKVTRSSADALREAPVIEDVRSSRSFQSSTSTSSDPARLRTSRPNEVAMDVSARRAGHVILADTFYPGWRAEVDGEEVPIKAANGAFRAVAVGAGHHEVRFTYASAAVRWGWISTLLTFAALAVVAGASLARRRFHRPRHR